MEKIIGDEDRNEERMIGSPSSDGKMVIKLKIPKLAAAIEGEKSSEEDVIRSFSTLSSKMAKEGEMMNQGKRVCPECKKEFSSGKALGGHMRVHVQAANKNTFLKHSSKTTKFNKDYAHLDCNNGDENLKKQYQQQQEERKPYYASCVNDEGKPTCSLCGKIFPSMKSLFGHMRCHPERRWRGILPPPNTPTPTAAAPRRNLVKNKPSYFASSTSSSSLSENYVNEEGSNVVDDGGAGSDQVVDLTKFLRGWSVTERRGRRALKAADDDEVLLGAVEDLMSLAHADPSPAESDVTQRQLGGVAPVAVLERSNSNSLTNKDHKIDKSPSIHLSVSNGKGKAAMVEEIKPVKMEFDGMIKNFSDNESDCRNTEQLLINYKYKNPFSSPSYNSPTKIKKRKKMKLMMELEHFPIVAGDPTPPPPLLPMALPLPEQHESKYKCTTCNKCFASHQALGGHRSSHNKTKLTSTTDHHHHHHHHHQTEPDDYESSLMNLSGEHVGKEVEFAADAMVALESNGILHQCKICDKIFPTGQALGGHKRCHWTGTIEAQAAPSSQITSTGEAASQTAGSGRRKGLDIDLNEFPPATMMEDEAGNVNGYASSSYNSNIG